MMETKKIFNLVLPATGTHGWHISEGWVNTGIKDGYINKIYRPRAEWGDQFPRNDDKLLEDLNASDENSIYIVLGMDWHSQPLTKTEIWKNAWKKTKAGVVAIIWEDYNSNFVQSNRDFRDNMNSAAQNMIECVDWVYTNHELNVDYFNNTYGFNKISFLPFAIDHYKIKKRMGFKEKKNALLFKGKIDNFGFEVGPYQKRIEIISLLKSQKHFQFEFNEKYITDDEFSELLDDYKYHINLPSFSPSMTLRAFECMASGGLLFQFETYGNLTGRLFDDNKDLILYDPSDNNNIIQKLISVQKKEISNELVAESGRQKVLNFHTISKRYEQIYSHYLNLSNKTKSFLFNSLIFAQKSADQRGQQKFEDFLRKLNLTKTEKVLLERLEKKESSKISLEKKLSYIVIDAVFFQIAKNGIARVFDSLIEKMIERGLKEKIIILNRGASYDNKHQLKTIETGLVDFNSPPSRVTNDIDSLLPFRKNFIFLSSYYTTSTYGFNVQIAHDMIPELLGGDDPVWNHKADSFYRAHFILAVSNNTRRDLLEIMPHIQQENVACKYNGTPLDIYRLAKKINNEHGSFKLKAPLEKNKYFVFVGGRRGWKGYKNGLVVLRALNYFEANEILRDYKILFIGGDKDLEYAFKDVLDSQAEKKVVLIQADDYNYLHLLKNSAGLIYPSIYEGFGLPILEAFSVGCTVISSGSASMPEVGGDYAIYFDPYSHDDLFKKLVGVAKKRLFGCDELIEYALTHESNWDYQINAILHRFAHQTQTIQLPPNLAANELVLKSSGLYDKIVSHYSGVSIYS